MASLRKLLFILFIIFLNLLLGINCAIIGMISPIEVVEERGCHHTEFRLTCGNLESQLAILEASFIPHCTHEDDIRCKNLDENRLTRAFPSQKIDSHIIEETEAGRKFLETLRKNEMHDDDDDAGTVSVVKVDASVSNEIENKENIFIPKQEERISLRSRLERLLVTYLKKLTSDRDEDNDDYSEKGYSENLRNRRNLNNLTSGILIDFNQNLTETNEQNLTSTAMSETMSDDRKSVAIVNGDYEESTDAVNTNYLAAENSVEKVIVDEKQVIVSEDMDNPSVHSSSNHHQKENLVHKIKLECSDKEKSVFQLNRLVLEESFREKDNEYNIRNVLNYRCSGKNHCSFIFSSDHYMAKVLGNGTIRIRYACMEDFRVIKFCQEHLLIGNELTQLPVTEKRRPIVRGEPRAEARINNMLAFHQFTNLKILKPSTTEDEEEQTETIVRDKERLRNKTQTKQRIYSQDFTLLKVLPSNLDESNDVRGDEFYFKKNGDGVTSNDIDNRNIVTQQTGSSQDERTSSGTVGEDVKSNVISDNEISTILSNDKINTFVRNTTNIEQIQLKSISSTIPSLPPVPSTASTPARLTTITATSGPTAPASTEYEIIIREGDQYLTTFPDLITTRVSTHKTPEINLVTTITTQWEKEILDNYPNILEEVKSNFSGSASTAATLPVPTHVIAEEEVEVIENEIDENSVRGDRGKGSNKSKEDQSSAKIQHPFIYDIDDSTEDDYDEYDDEDDNNGYRYSQKRKYTSLQRTVFRKPLLQGFAMSPGYPKFYIGGAGCNWTITVPGGQKIRVSLLDIALRYDDPCRDYLAIRDSETNKELFSGCTENERPIEIISESNQIQITLRTMTETAYPKRGVLFHYSALGCVVPFTPAHVNVLERTERYMKYSCEPSYVFPDTAVVNRELYCTKTHTWDKTLPDCVEQKEVAGSGLVLQFEGNRKKEARMVDEADTLYDIVIPSFIIASLFIVNGLILAVILRYRNKRKQCLELESKELAEL